MSITNSPTPTAQNPTTSLPPAVKHHTTVDSVYAATEPQLEVWLSSQQSADANCAYNEISSLEFRGQLDQDALEAAIRQVLQRNASLRSTFSQDGSQVFEHRQQELKFEFLDWSQTRDEANLRRKQRELIAREGNEPFDLVTGPLIRFVLQKLSTDHHKLTFTAHHLVMDGWSLAVFCRDLGYFYDVARGKSPPPLPAEGRYENYAAAMDQYQQSEQRESDAKFWQEMFEDSIPVLELPNQSPRPLLRTYSGARYEHYLDAALVEKIRLVGAKSSCSLFSTILSAFNGYIAQLSGCDDFCIGIPTAGQSDSAQPELIGHCVNTLPLRTRVDAATPFREYLKQTQQNLLSAVEHQRLSFGAILRMLAPPRDPSRAPLVNVLLNVDPVVDCSELGFDDLEVSLAVEPRTFENFEWFINGVVHQDKSIEFQVQYNTDLFQREEMQFYFEGFEAFLKAIAEEPARPIGEYPRMSIRQRQQALVDWNETHMDYPVDATLHAEFSRQASQTPERVAVEFEGRSLTYAEVEQQSNRTARFLKQHGVQAGDLVGICVERSEQMLVHLFAIMKVGAGYVPLDPAYPTDRLQYMCDHSELSLVVTQSSLQGRVSEFGKPLLALDTHQEQIASLEASPLACSAKPKDICYVIYTSGSTGKPKGVQVPHGAVVNFLFAMQREPGFTIDDSLLAITTLSFDIAVLELYLPTITGGRVVILDSQTAADGGQLIRRLEQDNVSLLQATPATWRLLIQNGWTGQADLKVLCGGEPMPRDLVGPLLERCGELWNMYGPTETTVWSAAFRITDATAPILIGKPVGNTQIYILDHQGREVSVGCEGELYIGGAGVTLGYRNRPDLTEERFVDNRYRNPFVNYVSDRLYKTGDLARYRFDGNLEFLRRNDKQVKVRGFRIELGEIEQTLKSHPAVQHNVVIVREDNPGDTRLVAYLVLQGNEAVPHSELRDHLRSSLPPYMVPQHFVILDQMPQTNNGKIDFKQLPAPNHDSSAAKVASDDSRQSATPSERFLADLWESVLEHARVQVDDTFFDVGGHSLLVMQVIALIEAETGVKLGPQDFMVNTLGQLAHKIDQLDQIIDSELRSAEETQVAAPTNGEDTGTDPARGQQSALVSQIDTAHGTASAACPNRLGIQLQYFGPPGAQLLGVHHSPTAEASNRAVLICPPLGQEYIRTHWALRLLANQLARKGHHVLRFDYRGHGDSFGDIQQVRSLQEWRQDIEQSITFLKQKTGNTSVSLVGLRAGAALAVDVAGQRSDIDCLVAWEAINMGREYLQDLQEIHATMLDLWPQKLNTVDNETHTEILGWKFQQELLKELDGWLPDFEQLQIPQLIVNATSRTSPSATPWQELIHFDEQETWSQLDQLEFPWLRPKSCQEIVSRLDSLARQTLPTQASGGQS